MTIAQAFPLVLTGILCLFVSISVAVFYWKRAKERRAERSRIEEHEDRFWRQVG